MPEESSEADKAPAPPAIPEPTRHRPLTGWERGFSAAAGVVLATVAVVVMFVGRNDVADSVALLVAGVLVVMAVQGTPLVKLGAKDVNLEYGRREAVAKIAEARAVKDPDAARALLEGYQIADPQARHDPVFANAADDVAEAAFLGMAHSLFDYAMGRLNLGDRLQRITVGNWLLDVDGVRILVTFQYDQDRVYSPTLAVVGNLVANYDPDAALLITNRPSGIAGFRVPVITFNIFGPDNIEAMITSTITAAKSAKESRKVADGSHQEM